MVENVTWIRSGITINAGVNVKIQKNISTKKVIFWNPARYSYKNGKYERSIIGDSVVICNEIIEETIKTKTIQTKSTSTNFYILLSFLLITIALLIAIGIYLVKQWSKQKHLLPYPRIYSSNFDVW